MFNLRFLDEIGKLIDIAKDSIINIVNSCKDTINLHITNNANGINTQNANVVIAARDNVKSHTTAEANNIRNSLISGKVPAVKSVQRGIQHGRGLDGTDYSFDRQYRDIKINSVNLAKATVSILDGNTQSSSTGGRYVSIYGRLIDSSTLRVYQNYFSNSSSQYDGIFNVVWEVVEFY